MKNLRWARVAKDALRTVGRILGGMDANAEGTDDALSVVLLYAADVVEAIAANAAELPRIPEGLLALVGQRIKLTSIWFVMPLSLAQSALYNAYEDLAIDHPKRALFLEYISRLIGAILDGKPIPEPSKNELVSVYQF